MISWESRGKMWLGYVMGSGCYHGAVLGYGRIDSRFQTQRIYFSVGR